MRKPVTRILGLFLFLIIFTVSASSLSTRAMSKEYTVPYVNGEEGTPKYGGTMRITAANYVLKQLNPLLNFWAGIAGIPYFDTLLTYDENCSLQSDLAESYEVAEDGLSVTFHLYENVTWHDGTEFNASDVKFTFDTILHDPKVNHYWPSYAYGINSTEVINASTIVFYLNEPLAPLLGYLSYIPIIPRHIYEGTELDTNPANASPIGTGPFKFESWTSEVNLTVAANEEYFGGRPFLDKIFYNADIQVSDFTGALENNTIDVVPRCVDPSKIDELQTTTGTSVETREAAQYNSIYLNISHPILQNRNIREAIAHAINKTKITTEAYCGYASVARSPLPSSLQYWYNPNVTDYELNRTLAEELMDGEYPRGSDGWRFSLVIDTYMTPVPWNLYTAGIIEDDLKSVGINATVNFGMSLGDIMAGNFDDAALAAWAFDALGPDDLYLLFHSNEEGNYAKYSNPTLDALLEEGRTSFNETLRKIDFDRAQEIITQDLPQIFLYHPYVAVAHNNDFHGRISTPPLNTAGGLRSYFLKDTWYDPTLSGKGNCPYRICFTDTENRRTGYYDGAVYEDIPNSSYSGNDSDPQRVKIREPTGTYTVELLGTENASYKFEFANIALNYKDVWIPEGSIHEGETVTYIVKVYGDGSIKVYDFDKFSAHDLGVRSMAASKNIIGQGYTAGLNGTVVNWGDYTESSNITFYANTTVIGAFADVALMSAERAPISVSWNTTGFVKGVYIIWVYVQPVLGELDGTDNNRTVGVLTVTISGDITGEGMCDMQDISIMIEKFMVASAYNPNVDVDNDANIDMADISLAVDHFMQT